MDTAVATTLKLPRRASYADVEPMLSRLGQSSELAVDLLQFRDAELSVDAALLALMLLAKRRAAKITVELGLDLPEHQANPDFPLWQLFLRTASGLVLAQMADTVLDRAGRDVRDRVHLQQRTQLSRDVGLMWSGKEVVAPIVDRFGAPKVAPALAGGRVGELDRLLNEMCCRLNLEPGRRPSFVQLCTFTRHVMENTYDHAVTDLEYRPLDGVRFLALRRINFAEISTDRLVAGRVGPEADYLRGLSEHKGRLNLTGGHLVEMTIADSGVGIPARQAGTEAVYEGSLVTERDHLLAALSPGGTSKPSLVTGSGYGLNRAIEAVAAVGGLLVLRTGRHRAAFDGLKHQDFDRMATFSPTDYFHLSAAPYAPGTSFSVLIPWRLVQAQADLFGGLLDAYRGR